MPLGNPLRRFSKQPLSYESGSGLLYYASIGKGFRIGGANPPVPAGPCAADLSAFGRTEAPAAFTSDRLWNHEAGIKGSLAGRRLHFALAVFSIDWKDIQQPVTLPNCGFSYVDNLGAARSRGFELEAQARLAEGLGLITRIGFVDARFVRTTRGGVAEGVEEEAGTIVARGDRVPFVPRWTADLALDYRWTFPHRLRGFARIDYRYSSSYSRAPSRRSVSYDARVHHGESQGMMVLRAGLERDGWQVAAFVRNLLDERAILYSSADLAPVTGTPLRQMTQRPRTAGIEASLRF